MLRIQLKKTEITPSIEELYDKVNQNKSYQYVKLNF